jgi:hypothetical protein
MNGPTGAPLAGGGGHHACCFDTVRHFAEAGLLNAHMYRNET